jgi:hypothetical protein
MDWLRSCLEQHSTIDQFNQVREIMLSHPGFARVTKPYSQVTQWSGKKMKAHRDVIVAVVATTLLHPSANQRIPFIEALLCIKNFPFHHLMVQYWYHTDATIEYMDEYLEEVHR